MPHAPDANKTLRNELMSLWLRQPSETALVLRRVAVVPRLTEPWQGSPRVPSVYHGLGR